MKLRWKRTHRWGWVSTVDLILTNAPALLFPMKIKYYTCQCLRENWKAKNQNPLQGCSDFRVAEGVASNLDKQINCNET
jgi:hypothetical protein